MPAPADSIDARSDRAVQAAVGVLLLAAFVFRQPWIVVAVAVLLAFGAALGPGANPFHRAVEAWILPRLPQPEVVERVPGDVVRAQDLLGLALLTVAVITYVIGLRPVGWLFTVVEAVIAVLAATTRVHVGDRLRRLRRHG